MNVTSDCATKKKQSNPQVHYSPCPSLPQSGWRFLWISFWVFQSQERSQSSCWLWTDFLSILIFAPYPTLLHRLWSLNISWIRSSNCMACPLPLCLIMTRSSSVTFGRNSLGYKVPNYNSVLSIIHKLTVKLKQPTNVWRPTLGVSLQKRNISGYNGYH